MKATKRNTKKTNRTAESQNGSMIKEFFKRNFRYITVAVGFVILVIILVVSTGDDKDDKEKEKTDIVEETTAEDSAEPETETEEATEEETAEEVSNDLLTDAYPDINALVASYFTAITNSDLATLSQIVVPLSEAEQNALVQKKEYIESYNNIVCYSKAGPVENSHIIFAYHEIKFININTMAPGLELFYVMTDESGKLYFNNGEIDADTEAYVNAIIEEPDVKALFDTVNTKYQEAQAADADLKAFVEQLAAVAGTAQ
ncbi:hypothetical protein [Anaerobium acetethylicum]|uniref:Uncharacterized protein n=1 Tax=Anaerobium acetethylicum TaxID=1619234 RepID=A0A1D3TVA4_9FIRM|nr:hypothetical protein [Anaerobium acetethylicum]SCP98083.1 hypothetical protein SAMN05421730_101653 [Anaerobium acetethylicum]